MSLTAFLVCAAAPPAVQASSGSAPAAGAAAAAPGTAPATPAPATPAPATTAGAPAAPATHDETFARILKLEDLRTTGDGELAGYLDPARPLEVRLRAALALGRIGAPVATPYDLAAALRDAEPRLRRMAAFALGEMDDVKAAPLLASSLADGDAEVRALAAEALGKLKDPASAPILTQRLGDADPGVAGMTLLALWKIDAGPLLAGQVVKASSIYAAAAGELRQRAAYFLMRSQMGHPDDEAIESALTDVARDADPLIRSFAARGLGAVRSAQSTQTLVDLADDDDWRVRVNAFNALRTRRVEAEGFTKKRWRVYKRALSGGRKEEESGVALSALAALESCGAADAPARLREALADPRPRFREVAALALAGRDKGAALPLLRPLAADPVWSVRARVAEALGGVGGETVAGDLERLAADADAKVRAAAIEATAKAKTAGGARLVAAALEDGDFIVRATALDALGAEPAARATQDAAALVKILEEGYRRARGDAQNDARLAALSSMAKIGGDEARAAVERAFDDPDWLVRRRAADLLRDTWRLDRSAKVGGPAPGRPDADYLAAVARARRRVTATFETDAGRFDVELFSADAPLTVDNFIRLARDGWYDGLAFHRVVPNFVIQDGDPRGDGNGGPRWQIRCEINLRRYGAGAVGMALSGKDTGGSQYFVTQSPQPHLDGGYTVFGQVIAGQEVVDRMVQGDGVRRVTITETDGPS